MVRAHLLGALIPMGISNLPQNADIRYGCFDCGEELSLKAQSSFCELWLPWTPQRKADYKAGGAKLMRANHIIGRVCLACAEQRDRERIEHAHANGLSVALHQRYAPKNENTVFRMPLEELGGVRTVCDGQGDWLMTYVVTAEQRLQTGDSRYHVRATDRAHRQWHGWLSAEGYVTLRPYKAKEPRRPVARGITPRKHKATLYLL